MPTLRYPRQGVVDAHRPPMKPAGICRCAWWQGIARINRDQLPGDLPFIEEFGEVAGPSVPAWRKMAMVINSEFGSEDSGLS